MSEEQDQRRARRSTPNPNDPDRSTDLPETDLPGSIGVYDRPTGLRRFPAWLIILVLLILAILAFLVIYFVI
jgi:hypothetical protein